MFQLFIVSVMRHSLQTFSADFLQFLLKRRHLKIRENPQTTL